MRRFAQYAVILFFPLLSGHTPGYRTVPTLQQELADLTRSGYTYRYLDNNLIELSEPTTGTKYIKSLATTDEATIHAWAQQRGVPIIEIDPAQIDTNLYAGWHQYWTEVPLFAGFGSLLLADLNQNGRVDIYGVYKDFQSGFESRVYEIDPGGSIYLDNIYPSFLGTPQFFANSDADSLVEVGFVFDKWLYDYEQAAVDSLPTRHNFQHDRWQGNEGPGYTGMRVDQMDGDPYFDFLYEGAERDSIDTTIVRIRTYIAEYDSASNNFQRIWSIRFTPEDPETAIGGFSIGDFDNDGKKEFVCSAGLLGEVFAVENTSDNEYQEVWQDSTPFVNLYYHQSADLNGDGKAEFFVGATMSNGNWTTIYESDSNNGYSPRVILHILAGGSLDEPNYISSDIDGDGKPEVLIASGAGIFVIKWQTAGYYLWYYKFVPGRLSARVYNFFNDSKQSLVIGRLAIDTLGRGRFYSDIYRPGPALSVREDDPVVKEFSISSNYPNPFNPSTSFRYSIASKEKVVLKIYDLLGREVATLVDEFESPGIHIANWVPKGITSGLYLYYFRADGFTKSGKMVYLR